MPAPTAPARAVDLDALVEGAVTALYSAAAITADVPRTQIVNGFVVSTLYPRIVVDLPSDVLDNTYGATVTNTLMDVSIYTQGDSTAVIRRVTRNVLAVLVDSPWTATGWTIDDVLFESRRRADDVQDATLYRGRILSLRVYATAT